jgi:hypothetical protein
MLTTTANLDDPDGVFAALIDAHRDLSPEASRKLDAKLVLLLANHVGSVAVLREAILAALSPHPDTRPE